MLKMNKLFTIGEKIWIVSIILYCVWVLIGFKLQIPYELISIYGSIGMFVFVILINLLRFLNTTNNKHMKP